MRNKLFMTFFHCFVEHLPGQISLTNKSQSPATGHLSGNCNVLAGEVNMDQQRKLSAASRIRKVIMIVMQIMNGQNIRRCNILGVDVCVTTIEETLKILTENKEGLKGKYICVSNVHTVVMSHDDERYRNIQNSGFMVLPDGKPLSVVSRIRGFRDAARVTGPDLMKRLFELSPERSFKHYFYGSTGETLDMLGRKLRQRYPGIQIAGMYSPPFRDLTEAEDREIIGEINKSRPDFVWVGLGAPKQEIWMSGHLDKINGIMIGVGAGFDYFAGNIKRAPLWMQKLSLEWLFRLLQDPKRLWRRYMETNARFIMLVIKESFDRRNKPKKREPYLAAGNPEHNQLPE
jgi:N-acetylglucosaminyldiphosphoundecaprenol N-acetyl-beta-D-mannosaminyltransferase